MTDIVSALRMAAVFAQSHEPSVTLRIEPDGIVAQAKKVEKHIPFVEIFLGGFPLLERVIKDVAKT